MRNRRPSFGALLIGLWSIGLLWSGVADAVVIEHLEVRRRGLDYSASLAAVLDAPLLRVWEVLTDYPGFRDLSPLVSESEVLAKLNPTKHRVRTRAQVCVLLFCKELHQVQTLHQ